MKVQNMTKQMLSVSAIKNGSVIDHIPTGEVLNLVHLLKLTKHQLNIGTLLPSKRLGYKDLLKVHNLALSEKEIHHIALFAPQATINIIKDFEIIKKVKAYLPKEIQGLLICPNTNCITQMEKITTIFYVKPHKDKVYFTCRHCQKDFLKDEVKSQSL
jgi:aspartate carbamoyltransferase regulatory subunit